MAFQKSHERYYYMSVLLFKTRQRFPKFLIPNSYFTNALIAAATTGLAASIP